MSIDSVPDSCALFVVCLDQSTDRRYFNRYIFLHSSMENLSGIT